MAFLPGAQPPRRAVLLVNPGARRGGEAIDGILARLRGGGVAVREAELGAPEEIEAPHPGGRATTPPTAPSSAAATAASASPPPASSRPA